MNTNEIKIKANKEHSNIPAMYKAVTVDNYEVLENADTVNKIKEYMKNITPDNAGGMLTLVGRVGTGKTHLVCAIGNELLERGVSVLFLTAPQLLNEYIKRYSKQPRVFNNDNVGKYVISTWTDEVKVPADLTRYASSYELHDALCRLVDVLIIDDLGTENGTEWAEAQIDDIVNTRYSTGLTTIITTNTGKLPERAKSRMMGSAHYVLKGQDYRQILHKRHQTH